MFLEDTRRGLFSYEALKSRLADSAYLESGYRSLSAPVIRLRTLSASELLALVTRLNKLFVMKHGLDKSPVTDEQSLTFINRALERAGSSELMTPREIIRDYLTLMTILKETPGTTFEQLMKGQRQSAETTSEATTEKPAKKINIFDIDI